MYIDVGYVGLLVDRITSLLLDIVCFLVGNLVTQRGNKQNVAVRSNAEYEFRIMTKWYVSFYYENGFRRLEDLVGWTYEILLR